MKGVDIVTHLLLASMKSLYENSVVDRPSNFIGIDIKHDMGRWDKKQGTYKVQKLKSMVYIIP